jgi:hypothetical protein
MPRGGKRPGAGAPKRNLNALKTGERSAQVAAVMALMSTPSIRRIIRELRRKELQQVERDLELRSILDDLYDRTTSADNQPKRTLRRFRRA